jgi:hypothetical protein
MGLREAFKTQFPVRTKADASKNLGMKRQTAKSAKVMREKTAVKKHSQSDFLPLVRGCLSVLGALGVFAVKESRGK